MAPGWAPRPAARTRAGGDRPDPRPAAGRAERTSRRSSSTSTASGRSSRPSTRRPAASRPAPRRPTERSPRRIGHPTAVREVGQALGRNRTPIIVPCHRVVAAGGKLGGFSARGGTTTKGQLLAIEGSVTPTLPFG
ncbi:MAG: MGMT family protein [Acidimicrobiia bacterium]|nr:MGMT family protein [Acidimicrobiia bacterium]